MYKNKVNIELDSNSTNEAFARMATVAFLAPLDPTIDELSDIKTAVSEAVTNAIIHGYENKEGVVTVKCKIIDKTIEIQVIDKGKGIENIDMARQALYTSKPDLERSGIGFTIMESFMDELKVESTPMLGTTVIMRKNLEIKK